MLPVPSVIVRVFSQTRLSAGGPVEHQAVSRARQHEGELVFDERHFAAPDAAAETVPVPVPVPVPERPTATLGGVFVPVSPRSRGTASSSPAVRFLLRARARSPRDVAEAEAAEMRGKAGGMGALAARCPEVWELSFSFAEPSASDASDASDTTDVTDALEAAATWSFLALLASIALGPILPPDGSTLLGVRSARERAERLARAPEPSTSPGVEIPS